MSVRNEKAAEYRRQATLCLEVAERISIREDRERLIAKSREWLRLAEEAEAEER